MLENRVLTGLKRQLEPLGQKVSDDKLLRLLYRVRGDRDLALTALVMRPRPEWVQRIIGPLP